MTIDGMTVMVPVHTAPAFASPYFVDKPDDLGRSRVSRDGAVLGEVSFPVRPHFYDLSTADGIPYWKIAVLLDRERPRRNGAADLFSLPEPDQDLSVLRHRAVRLEAGRTIGRKTPAQLPRSSSPQSSSTASPTW